MHDASYINLYWNFSHNADTNRVNYFLLIGKKCRIKIFIELLRGLIETLVLNHHILIDIMSGVQING